MYCLVVTDDYSRFIWVFFLATNDETSVNLKSFITVIENLVDHKVKVIRCDNGIEFKNIELNQFCKMKGILRQFSISRTLQRNRVAERRTRRLIEAARTTLADSKSKAFRVFNSRTRIMEENLHIIFSIKASDNASQARKETEPVKDYILLPIWTDDPPFSQDPNNNVKTISSTDNVAGTNEVNAVSDNISIKLQFDPNMPALEDVSTFNFSRDNEDDDAMADMNNLDTTIQIKEEVYVCQPLGFEDLDIPDKVYKVEKASYGLHHAPRAWLMIGSLIYLTSLRPDIMFAVCACARYQVNLKVSHLHAVKRIFRYLKGQPKLGLWYPKDYAFDLVAYTDSDYAGASLDRKSTTGVTPTIYISCIIQFWSTAMAKTINEEAQLHAKVDRKKIIVIKSFVRIDLRLADEEGIDCLPNSTIFEQLSLMGYENLSQKLTFYKPFFSPQWKFLIHTILQCLSPKTTGWNEFSSTIASAIISLATNQKFNFSKLIFDSMIRNLDNVSDETVHKELGDRLVRAATNSSSLELVQDSVNITKTQSKETPNEPSSQGTDLGSGPRVLDLEKTKTTQHNEIVSLKRRVKKLEKKNMSRTHRLKRLYKVGLTARVESLGNKESLGEDASKQVRRIDTINADEDITLVSVQDDAENKMFDVDTLDGEEAFVAGQNENVVEEVVDTAQVSTAVITVTITTKEITLAQALQALKTSKPKQKVEDDKEIAELKQLMETIADEEEVANDAIPLAVKEDLKDLYKLVKARYGSTRPIESMDYLSWSDMKIMFQPHVEDEVWKLQNRYKVLEWKLSNSCGVHSLMMQSMQIYMLVEKNPDDEEDTRSSQEYMNDLDEEYQARSLLAKSKRFFKKGTQRSTKDFEAKYNKVKAKLALLSSSALAYKDSMVKNKGLITKAYELDVEEVSSDDNDMVEVKVLMALAEDKDAVSKEGAKNGKWVKISMRKVHTLLEMEDNDDRKNYLY
nr:uncharacterized mitochondrial protein AtMg00810-like [Tanacetum cinerariifolium]